MRSELEPIDSTGHDPERGEWIKLRSAEHLWQPERVESKLVEQVDDAKKRGSIGNCPWRESESHLHAERNLVVACRS